MTEKELIQQCIKGNAKAQKALYTQHSGKMFGVCLRYADNEDEAKDFMQEGFIKVFTKLSTFNGNGSFEGWIRRTMVNTCLDNIRKMKYIKLHVELEHAKEQQYAFEDVLSIMATDDLLKLIQKMPKGYRTVFNLYAIEGYSHKEIGDELGVSENTSKSQYRKAKLYLQEKLELLENSNLKSGKAG